MIFRIEKIQSDSVTVLVVSGKLTSPAVQQLKAEISDAQPPIALDLQQVRLVDLDAVHYLAEAARGGIELRHVPQYVHEWVSLQRSRNE